MRLDMAQTKTLQIKIANWYIWFTDWFVVCNIENTYVHVRGNSLVLTQFTRCSRISNIPIGTGANRIMIDNLAECIASTRVSNCTGIDAFSIFTCSVIWAISIWAAARYHIWRSWQICRERKACILDKRHKRHNSRLYSYLFCMHWKDLLDSLECIDRLQSENLVGTEHSFHMKSIYMLKCTSLDDIFLEIHSQDQWCIQVQVPLIVKKQISV